MSAAMQDLSPFLAGAALRGVVLLLVAHVVAAVLEEASAAAKDMVWRAAFVGVLALPAMGAALPGWSAQVPVRTIVAPAGLEAPEVDGAWAPLDRVIDAKPAAPEAKSSGMDWSNSGRARAAWSRSVVVGSARAR